MELFESTSKSFFVPFFPQSVNVISATTNSGKTSLLINILKQRNFCFIRPFSKVVVILCNPKVDGSIYQELADDSLEVDICYLEDFSPDENLSENALVIFEDVSRLSDPILECINVNAHHLDLASLFIVCQSIFAEEDFKSLLSLAHRIFIYFSGTGGTKLAQYIRKFFFVNAELKEYFGRIISYGESHKVIVLFELNEIARKDKPHFLALAGFENLFNQDTAENNMGHTLVFPHLHKQNMYENEFGDNNAEIEGIDPSTLPRGSYLLVKAENVTKKTKKGKTVSDNMTECEKDWEHLNNMLKDDIESLNLRQQRPARDLAKSMLSSKSFCISKNGKTVFIANQPKTKIVLMDFLNVASRASGPNEIPEAIYVLFANMLLKSKTPRFFIKNKSLLPSNTPVSKKQKLKTKFNFN